MGIEEKLMHIQTQIKAPKNLYNSFGKYKYRNAESICEAVKPFLESEKVSLRLSDEIVALNDRIYVKATVTLCDIEKNDTISVSAMARESLEKKGMDDSQITGAASSYARKYALNGLFLLDDTKDADSDEFHDQTQKKADEFEQPADLPPMASSDQLKKLTDFVSAYAQMVDGKEDKDIWNLLKKKYNFSGTGEITEALAEILIKQVTIWYEKQKAKQESDK